MGGGWVDLAESMTPGASGTLLDRRFGEQPVL
jgi:hypothetical protein